jgi:hypothetical protein
MNTYPFVTIYGEDNCKYTLRAIDLCLDYNHPYHFIQLWDNDQKKACKNKYEHYSLPICVECYPDNERLIGGSDNLKEYLEDYYP